ncbi:MAG: hypothetical protein ABIQ02_09645 [Saprospiraceae bacterium]
MDCKGQSGIIKLKLTKDGQDALIGPAAFINRDSVKFFIPGSEVNPNQAHFNALTNTMDLFLEGQFTYVLELDSIRTDTILPKFTRIGRTDCCEIYEVSNVRVNGNIICQNGCTEIIEIQL